MMCSAEKPARQTRSHIMLAYIPSTTCETGAAGREVRATQARTPESIAREKRLFSEDLTNPISGELKVLPSKPGAGPATGCQAQKKESKEPL